MKFVKIKDTQGAERHINFDHVADVRFEDRNRSLREETTIVMASGHTIIAPKEYRDVIRAALYPAEASAEKVALAEYTAPPTYSNLF